MAKWNPMMRLWMKRIEWRTTYGNDLTTLMTTTKVGSCELEIVAVAEVRSCIASCGDPYSKAIN
jgi:hypothetical protein